MVPWNLRFRVSAFHSTWAILFAPQTHALNQVSGHSHETFGRGTPDPKAVGLQPRVTPVLRLQGGGYFVAKSNRVPA
jgi:hypothetical protein